MLEENFGQRDHDARSTNAAAQSKTLQHETQTNKQQQQKTNAIKVWRN